MTTIPTDPVDHQRDLFREAVDLLGGPRSAARVLDVNDRTMFRFLKGDLRINTHTLEKISTALLAHADRCRALERQLSPAFTANLTEAQARPPKHDASHIAPAQAKAKANKAAIDEAARKLGLK